MKRPRKKVAKRSLYDRLDAKRRKNVAAMRTLMESHAAFAMPEREKEPVLVFIRASKDSGKVDAAAALRLLTECFARVERAESAQQRAEAQRSQLVTKLVGLLTPDQIDHAKAADCLPELYACELLQMWKEKERARTIASSADGIMGFQDLKRL